MFELTSFGGREWRGDRGGDRHPPPTTATGGLRRRTANRVNAGEVVLTYHGGGDVALDCGDDAKNARGG